KGELGIHAAMGLRLRDDEFGLRPTAGLDYWLPGHPVELFIDAGPVFRLSPDEGVDTTAMLGVRFYLAQEKSK
ncbi:MAG: hypothetical protein KGK30_05605, partial [Elusimicrobia bacterium]|nr:hypothetical protein [Elusimicrobiota bacterium]